MVEVIILISTLIYILGIESTGRFFGFEETSLPPEKQLLLVIGILSVLFITFMAGEFTLELRTINK